MLELLYPKEDFMTYLNYIDILERKSFLKIVEKNG